MQQKKQMSPQEKRVNTLCEYLIKCDWRKANALLNRAGYPPAQGAIQMREYFMDWLQNDRSEALKEIMQAHPDRNLFVAANQLPDKPGDDPSFPLPNHFADRSNGYFDRLQYGAYPYTPQVLADHAYPRTPREQYVSGVVSGVSNYAGNHHQFIGENAKTKNLVLVILGLIALWVTLKRMN